MGNDPPIALRGTHPGTHGRDLRLELFVEWVLVPQTAHQPATGATDFHGIQRQILVLGHSYGDRFEVREERGAAQVTSAGADPALDAGAVPGGELTQVDAGSQRSGEIAYECSEIDSMVGTEVDGEDAVGLDVVDSDDFHG